MLHREQQQRQTQFARIAKKAQDNPTEQFTSLAHYLTEEFLIHSFRKLRKSAASGIDGKTCHDYELNLLKSVDHLHSQLREGKYKAPNIRRTWIDKGAGKKRPLGISTVEDKIVQRAVTDILSTIYEQDFYNFSYGYRPKRSAHKALREVHSECMNRRIKYVLDADIQGCFDNFDHKIMRQLLERRIKDKSLMRLINCWLKVGIIDGDVLQFNAKGTPQGNIISPLLCNIYLHYVLDTWIVEQVKPLMKGKIFIVRYADDFIIGFENKEDAQRVNQTLPKRMIKYGLTIHPEKTKLVEFNPWMQGKTPTIDFLGFTHYWTKSQKGVFVIKRRTTKKGLRKGILKIEECCKTNKL